MNKPRLIDANALKEVFEKYNGRVVQFVIMREIDKMPTAYDVEGVVEQLKDSKFWTEPTYDEDGYCNDDSWEIIDLDDAIEIVRKGGGKHDD